MNKMLDTVNGKILNNNSYNTEDILDYTEINQ